MKRIAVGAALLVLAAAKSVNECYISPSCITNEFYDKATGFTNDTGWSNTDAESCCQICLPGTPSTVCFTSTPECLSKTGDGDFDYLLLDQIWLPQFCASLSDGIDPTLSHLAGSTCGSYPHKLSIHGLWPNYFGGYPQCCNASGNMVALTPAEVTSWDIWPILQDQWADPTSTGECSVCYMLNHEWQKHGACYSTEPYQYFADTLSLTSSLQNINNRLTSFEGQTIPTSSIRTMYPKDVNVICDAYNKPSDNTGLLLEIRTCWDRNMQPTDCAPASTSQFGVPCPEYTIFRM